MQRASLDLTKLERLDELGRRVLDGGSISRDDAMSLFNLESTSDIFALMSWANRIREHFKGNKIHLCSIVTPRLAPARRTAVSARNPPSTRPVRRATALSIPNR